MRTEFLDHECTSGVYLLSLCQQVAKETQSLTLRKESSCPSLSWKPHSKVNSRIYIDCEVVCTDALTTALIFRQLIDLPVNPTPTGFWRSQNRDDFSRKQECFCNGNNTTICEKLWAKMGFPDSSAGKQSACNSGDPGSERLSLRLHCAKIQYMLENLNHLLQNSPQWSHRGPCLNELELREVSSLSEVICPWHSAQDRLLLYTWLA